MRTHSQQMLAALTLVVGLVVAGCSAGSAPASASLSPAEVAERYGYDMNSAQTPVFALVPQFKDPKDGYARDLLASECLEGVVTYTAVPPGAGDGLIDERTGQLNFSEEIAQQLGYPALRLPAAPDSAVPDDVTVTDAMLEAMSACGEQTDERLGAVPERFLNDVEAAGWDALAGDEAVQRALEAWRTCMEPAGVIDLPEDPHQMPPASVATTPEGAELDTADVTVPLTEREKEVAVLDARCRTTSGYDDAVHDARATAELAAIGGDVESFDASRREYEKYDSGLDAVLADLG